MLRSWPACVLLTHVLRSRASCFAPARAPRGHEKARGHATATGCTSTTNDFVKSDDAGLLGPPTAGRHARLGGIGRQRFFLRVRTSVGDFRRARSSREPGAGGASALDAPALAPRRDALAHTGKQLHFSQSLERQRTGVLAPAGARRRRARGLKSRAVRP